MAQICDTEIEFKDFFDRCREVKFPMNTEWSDAG